MWSSGFLSKLGRVSPPGQVTLFRRSKVRLIEFRLETLLFAISSRDPELFKSSIFW